MVAKISIGSSLYGALSYNGEKMNKEQGRVLGANKIILPADGQIDIARMVENFNAFMPKTGKAQKPVLQISLNPHPDDRLSEQQYEILAREYLDKLGFGEQPYIIYKHMDIDRHHIHIVTVNVNEQGKRLNQDFLYRRSKKITTELEERYNLHKAQREKITPDTPIKKLDPAGDIKRQVANTVKMVGMRYKFQSIGEYNAILSLYNIRCEQTDGRVNGREYHGLVYFATDDEGKTIASPFKASRLGKFASRTAIDGRFERAKEKIDIRPTKTTVSEVMSASSGKDDFIAKLKGRNIDLILRHTDTGRIYGATFIDHNTMTVLNGSRLGKEFSANALEKWFTAGEKPSVIPTAPDVQQESEQPLPDMRQPQSDNSQSQPDNMQPGTANSGQSTTGDSGAGTSQGQPFNQHQSQTRQGNSLSYDDVPTLPGLDLFQTGPGFDAEEEAFYRAMQSRKKKKRRSPKL